MSSSTRRRRAARANGKKSRGPVTPEGKARSAANSTRHGLSVTDPSRLAHSVCLTIENRDEFLALHQAYLARFAPACPAAYLIVEEMTVARWRLQRAWVMEKALYENQMDRMTDDLVRDYETMDQATRLGLAFRGLAESSPSVALLLRYEARLSRQIERCEKRLAFLREMDALPASPESTGNSLVTGELVETPDEPNPKNEHTYNPTQPTAPAPAPADQPAPAGVSGRDSSVSQTQPAPAMGRFHPGSQSNDPATCPELGRTLPEAA